MAPDSAFNPVHSRQSFFETPGVGEALRRLGDGLGAREPFLLVTGEPGTGKSALAHEAVARWGSRVTAAFLAYPSLTAAEFLEEILRRFGAEPPDNASRSKLVACVEYALAEVARRGQVALLVVDNAHDLSAELLEQLRLLVNTAQHSQTSLEVLLIGLPALEARLDQPEFVTIRQRVSVHAKLAPLSPAETRSYLHHRVGATGGNGPTLFTKRICRDIAARTRGIPRQINALAADALRLARAANSQFVGAEHVEAAAAALWGLAPPGNLEDPATAGSEETPSPLMPAPTPTPAPVATVAAAPAPKPTVAPAPAPPPQPAPKAEVPTPAPARPEPIETPRPPKRTYVEPIEAVESRHTPPTRHDPHEWVERFVGDKGPLQIGSLANLDSYDLDETAEAGDKSTSPAKASGSRRRGRGKALPRNSRHRVSARMAGTAVLAAIVVVTVVAVLIRAGGRAHGPASQVGGVAASAGAASDSASRAPAAPRKAGSKSKSSRLHTLDVGGYPDFDRANEELARVQELTGIEGWVVPTTDGDGEGYRVVLGAYSSTDRAQGAANMLLKSKTLKNVSVVPLPPRSVRR